MSSHTLDVVNEWMEQCSCCFYCGQPRPCDEVMADSSCNDCCDCIFEEIEQRIYF